MTDPDPGLDPDEENLQLSERLRRRLKQMYPQAFPPLQTQFGPGQDQGQKQDPELEKLSQGVKKALKDMLGDPDETLISMRRVLQVLEKEGLSAAWSDFIACLMQFFHMSMRKTPVDQQRAYIENALSELVNKYGEETTRQVFIEELNFYIEIQESIYMPKKQIHANKEASKAFKCALFLNSPWIQKTAAERAEWLKGLEES
jgi:hypothetical protein